MTRKACPFCGYRPLPHPTQFEKNMERHIEYCRWNPTRITKNSIIPGIPKPKRDIFAGARK